MAKITIVLEDAEGNATDVRFECDPPLEQGVAFTMAQTAGVRGLVFMKELVKGAIPLDRVGRPKRRPRLGRKKL